MKNSIKKFLDFLVAYKYFLPPDIYERHKFIGKFIKPNSKILDVGGSMSRLGEFTKNCEITTADVVEPADIIYDGKKIPVKNNSYDVITSIDVMEHIPSSAREDFVKEVVRVASKKIIISAPYGTDYHLDYERKTLKYYKSKNIKLPFLEEHVAIGLPTPEQVKKIKDKYNGKLYFSGDVRTTEKLFRIHTYENKNKFINYLVFFMKLGFNFLMNIFYYRFTVNKKENQYINRFYLVINKN